MLTISQLISKFSWVEGRQGSGYSKIRFLEIIKPLPMDIYLLKFPEGSSIPEHIDPVQTGYKHYRLNIILKKSISGGEFVSESHIFNFKRIKFFRADISKHSVTKVIGGNRIVLSIGFLLKNKGE
jgi:hypothetical protein